MLGQIFKNLFSGARFATVMLIFALMLPLVGCATQNTEQKQAEAKPERPTYTIDHGPRKCLDGTVMGPTEGCPPERDTSARSEGHCSDGTTISFQDLINGQRCLAETP